MEYMEGKMQDNIEAGISKYEKMSNDISYRDELLSWAYSKLSNFSFSNIDDALKMDEIKFLLEHGC